MGARGRVYVHGMHVNVNVVYDSLVAVEMNIQLASSVPVSNGRATKNTK